VLFCVVLCCDYLWLEIKTRQFIIERYYSECDRTLLFNDALSASKFNHVEWHVKITMNDQWVRIWKDAKVTDLRPLFKYSPGETQHNH
jgi:hypothetical protein